MSRPRRAATRGSTLALTQTRLVAALLQVDVELVVVETVGDRLTDAPISALGGQGVFVKEVQAAVLDGRADIAVHSAKDLPSAAMPGLVIGAVPERGDPRDALVGATFDGLPAGARVATGSVRRRAQLAWLRPDLTFAGLRGNMETRLAKAHGFDAIVVAAAALRRLGRADQMTEVLGPHVMLPQVGQGALAVECRDDDDATLALLATIDHRPSRLAVEAERAFLREVGGSCDLPVGAYATVDGTGGRITLEAMIASGDGRVVLRHRDEGDEADDLGRRVARHLLDDAGGTMLLDVVGLTGAVTVYLVGAGPGDPGLLTVRGAEVLARADVVVHDRLAELSLLDLAPVGAERIDVGKSPGGPVHQDAINALLVERGLAGDKVVRLKGGDPFVFGRGGEEAVALLEAGVPFEVVPGVSSAVGVPAYAGVPVTHRGLSTSFTVVTGHSRHAVDHDIKWESLAEVADTVVVLMGVAHRAEIAARLMAGGLPPTTPVAAIRWGTRPDQRTVRTTLAELHRCELEPPVTMVIGKVAGLDLRWFESRPLFGRRIVVTRARHQAPALSERLRRMGAEPVEVPTVEIADPDDGGAALRDAAVRARDFDWVCFTSANAVARFLACLRDSRAFGADTQVAAVGPGTAAALAAAGVVADLVPERSLAEGLVDAFPTAAGAGRVLLPQAAGARAVLARGLEAKGWVVEVVHAYRTVPIALSPEAVAAAAKTDAIAFTSASTVDSFLAAAGPDGVPPVVACIGPVTAAAAEAAGLTVDVVATDHTLDGLVAALTTSLSARASAGQGRVNREQNLESG